MEKIYHDLSLDFNETHTLKVVRIKQFDYFGRRIRLHLYNNGKAVSLNSNDDTVTLFAGINNVATAIGDSCDIENNAVIVHVGLPMTSIAGTEKCEVRVESANGRVHTATFDVLVEPATVTQETPKIISTADIFSSLESWERNSEKTITQFIINSINALHPEYTISTFSEVVEDESAATMTCVVDLNVYNPDKSDGLLVTADGVLVNPLAYTTAVENNAAVIRFGTSAGLQVGQTVYFTVYHKPQGSSGGTVSGTVTTISDGTVSNSIADDAQEIADEEETE